MSETYTLDPSEVASNRTEFALTPYVDVKGIDWGEAAIAGYMSEQIRGETPVDFRIPNRVVSIPLTYRSSGTITTDQARSAIASKVARFQQEGGWFKRVTSAGTLYLDVVNASLAPGDQWLADQRDVEPGVSLVLEALPDFYGNEITLADHSETTAAELIFTETGIDGDYPARVRIVVDEDDAEDQRGLIWGFRSRHYSSASSAASEYEAEELQTLDTAAKAALSGASGGTVVTHGTISTGATPVLGTNIGGSTYLTHTGTNRLYARVYSTSGTTVQVRAVYDVGDLVAPAENAWQRLPGASNFYIVDLGEIRLDQAPVGTHRWQGQIQAKGDVGTENVSIDKLWIVNQDEGAGSLMGSWGDANTNAFTTYLARSEFTTESGAITGDSLMIGGTWAGAGDTDDFSVAGGVATRTATSDTGGLANSRAVTASATAAMTTTYATVDVKVSSLIATSANVGLALRFVDMSNYLQVVMNLGSSASDIAIQKQVGGSATAIARAYPYLVLMADTWYTITAMISRGGDVVATFAVRGNSPFLTLAASDSVLATGGTLASGKVGLNDHYTAATALTRSYDNFAVWVPPTDAVAFASQSVQLTTEGMFREDSGGTAYGPVSNVYGDLPRLPPAGLEGRTTEVFIKGSRGDLGDLPDSGIDDISARVYYRPSWLFDPES